MISAAVRSQKEVQATSVCKPHIRLAISSDKEALEQIADQAYAKYLDWLVTPPDPLLLDYGKVVDAGDTYVIELDRKVAGMVTCRKEKNAYILRNLAVPPAFQGRGLGRLLAVFVEEEAKQQNIKTIKLWTREEMEQNIQFYYNLGYQITHRERTELFSRVYLEKLV